jgi:hypothetical protein
MNNALWLKPLRLLFIMRADYHLPVLLCRVLLSYYLSHFLKLHASRRAKISQEYQTLEEDFEENKESRFKQL